jgi:NADH-quinone oxidoreductase subunit E
MSEIQVSESLDRYPVERTFSLAVLQDIQREYKYLPREALEATAERLRMPLSEVYQIATFFKAFSLTPKGDNIVKVCLGTACHVGGGPRILAAVEKELGIKAGSTTLDYKFSLEAIRCVGACALGPVVVVGDHVHGKMSAAKATELISSLRQQEEALPEPEEA